MAEEGYIIPSSYGFGSIDEMLENFEENKPYPLNAKQVTDNWHRSAGGEELPRVLGTAVVLYANTSEDVDIWQCLYAAWVFERG